MAQSLQGAPWRVSQAPAQREPADSDLRLGIIATLDAHAGSALDDIVYATGMPESRPAQARVKRLLDGLVEEAEIERWLDNNEKPAEWRYWLFKDKPASPGPRVVLRPAVPKPPPVQEIVKDIMPKPAAKPTPAPMPEVAASAPTVSPAPLVEKAARMANGEGTFARVARLILTRPEGLTSEDARRLLGATDVGMALSRLYHSGKVTRRGTHGAYIYLPRTEPTSEEAAAMVARAKPGPKPRTPGDAPPRDLTNEVREFLTKAGPAGALSWEIRDAFGVHGQTVAAALAKKDWARREGKGPGSRYFAAPQREASTTEPLPAGVDALDLAVHRVRVARAELGEALAELHRVVLDIGTVRT